MYVLVSLEQSSKLRPQTDDSVKEKKINVVIFHDCLHVVVIQLLLLLSLYYKLGYD